MSNSCNTHATKLFHSIKVLTGIVLQYRVKYFFYRNMQNYEIMISYFVIFERFYQFFNKNDIPML